MSRSFHGERDYVFGQRMLNLRTSIGVTQEGLAAVLGVTRKAIGRWEVGETYPKAAHLQVLLALALQHGVFAVGQEEVAIRSFWRAAHQKVLLDDAWLRELLSQPAFPQKSERVVEQPVGTGPHGAPVTGSGPQVDWEEALDVPNFYGREEELALLSRWIAEEGCRVVSVLGMGGIGKSALAITVMQQVARQFDVVIWRSLRDSPSCATLVQTCLQVLDPQAQPEVPDALEDRLRRLMEQLRTRRVLLVLDNLETLLEEGTGTGRLRANTQGYGQLLHHLVETRHQSRLLLTSREKLADLVPLEGKRSPVRALRLAGLDELAGAQLLEEKDVTGTVHDCRHLVEVYRGNPLALKIVGQTIAELFGGEILSFLRQGKVIFGGVRKLLDEQYARLSELEQTVFCWLAILREPVSLQELLAALSESRTDINVLEALDRLSRRCLIERGQRPGSFTLQSVVLEYATGRLIEWASSEIEQGHLVRLIQFGLCQAQAKEYVRQIQKRLLVVPLLIQLQSIFYERADLEVRLLWLLDQLRGWDQTAQGYGPANLVTLLRVLRGELRGLNLSQLLLRSVYLQDIEMQDADLSGARLQGCVFTEAFDAVFTVATSPDGSYWAAGSNSGEVRIWREEGQTAHLVVRAHTNAVPTVAFSPDGQTLASGSWDCTVKLWDIAGKALVRNLQGHHGYVQSVAFRPDGGLLASGSDDGSIRLWDLSNGSCLQTLRGHQDNVYSVAWHPDGQWLASGSFDQTVRIWDAESGECLRTLSGHTHWVMEVAFTLDGKILASGGADNVVKLWEVESGRCQQTLLGHIGPVKAVAWSADGQTLVTGGYDTTIRLWQSNREMTWQTVLGHTDVVHAVALTPDGKMLLSGSEDRTLRVWEVRSGQCLRILQGYWVTLFAVAWSPDSRFLASGGTDCTITLWDIASKRPVKNLRGHTQAVYTLAWHPNGRLLASGGCDHAVCIWESTTGKLVHSFHADTSQITRVAWSPDGALLASVSYDQVLRIWDVLDGTCRWVGQGHTSLVSAVCWSPDGSRLATCSGDRTVRLWQAEDGTLLQTLQGHSKDVASIVWSPDGKILASCGGGGGSGELFLWDVEGGQLLRSLVGHPRHVFTIAWSPQGDILVSASIDGTLRWWNVESGVCLYIRQGHQAWISSIAISPNGEMLASCAHDGVIVLWDLHSGVSLQTLQQDRPYERLNITGIRGLSAAQKASLRALGAFEETSREE